jgi:hypothetical protein
MAISKLKAKIQAKRSSTNQSSTSSSSSTPNPFLAETQSTYTEPTQQSVLAKKLSSTSSSSSTPNPFLAETQSRYTEPTQQSVLQTQKPTPQQPAPQQPTISTTPTKSFLFNLTEKLKETPQSTNTSTIIKKGSLRDKFLNEFVYERQEFEVKSFVTPHTYTSSFQGGSGDSILRRDSWSEPTPQFFSMTQTTTKSEQPWVFSFKNSTKTHSFLTPLTRKQLFQEEMGKIVKSSHKDYSGTFKTYTAQDRLANIEIGKGYLFGLYTPLSKKEITKTALTSGAYGVGFGVLSSIPLPYTKALATALMVGGVIRTKIDQKKSADLFKDMVSQQLYSEAGFTSATFNKLSAISTVSGFAGAGLGFGLGKTAISLKNKLVTLKNEKVLAKSLASDVDANWKYDVTTTKRITSGSLKTDYVKGKYIETYNIKTKQYYSGEIAFDTTGQPATYGGKILRQQTLSPTKYSSLGDWLEPSISTKRIDSSIQTKLFQYNSGLKSSILKTESGQSIVRPAYTFSGFTFSGFLRGKKGLSRGLFRLEYVQESNLMNDYGSSLKAQLPRFSFESELFSSSPTKTQTLRPFVIVDSGLFSEQKTRQKPVLTQISDKKLLFDREATLKKELVKFQVLKQERTFEPVLEDVLKLRKTQRLSQTLSLDSATKQKTETLLYSPKQINIWKTGEIIKLKKDPPKKDPPDFIKGSGFGFGLNFGSKKKSGGFSIKPVNLNNILLGKRGEQIFKFGLLSVDLDRKTMRKKIKNKRR